MEVGLKELLEYLLKENIELKARILALEEVFVVSTSGGESQKKEALQDAVNVLYEKNVQALLLNHPYGQSFWEEFLKDL